MKKFKVTIINGEGREVPKYVDAKDSKEAIDIVCEKYNVGYENVVDFKELEA